MNRPRGTLIPIGGNEDKGSDEFTGLDFIEDGILAHVVRESGGVASKIIVVPTASSIPETVGENYLEAFEKLGCLNVEVISITKCSQCDDNEVIKKFDAANCVMFSGGDQSKITTKIGGTPIHTLLADKFNNQDFVIAGTSAGAMAMTSEMIAGGSSTEAMFKGAVRMKKGLGLIPELIVDTHFIRRGRFGRLAEAVAIHPHLMGVGLGEDTGLIIKNCNEFKVIGSGMVILMDASNLTHNAHEELYEGTPMSMSNLTTHILANGDQFTLNDKRIVVLPLNAHFV
ncbi:MAG: cyanophycinase [Cytophagales bacterium]|nr:cyanophycinase [Cytophagales bacterium]